MDPATRKVGHAGGTHEPKNHGGGARVGDHDADVLYGGRGAYWPWCSKYGAPNSDTSLTCAFSSWQQCMDTVRGIGGYCYTNPYPNPYTAAPGRPAQSRRHHAT
jgi:hypothetical protein